ncbi:DUF4350 domain-containing protein [Curtobacterium luteum]|uniref:DUF4350 domain-containing protein n=1 Tax=Curtobacterium luteum TaxID=33881 RepID=UPI00380B8383
MSATATGEAPAPASATAGPSGGAGLGPGPARRRRWGAWAVVAVVALLLAALTAAVGGQRGPGPRELDPDSATASGAKALVRVLERRGTDVEVVRSADRVGAGTVLVDDTAGALSAAVARRIARTADHVVLVGVSGAALQAFGLEAEPVATVDDDTTVSTASCAIPEVAAAGSVTAGGTAYRVTGAGTDRCVPTGSGADRGWGIVRAGTAAGDVTLLGTTSALRNDTITSAGDASLALGLLGGSDRLTWYVPVPGGADTAPTLGDLAPPWVPSLVGLLALVAVAAGVWRGRRLGPLVVEPMPVVVRAAETTEGRARLYARTRDRAHALDTLRVAALRRIAAQLGLPRSAHVDEVVRRAARATGRPDAEVGRVLVGSAADSDAALTSGAAALDELERAVSAATTGASPPPTTTARRSTRERPGAPERSRPTDHDGPGARP